MNWWEVDIGATPDYVSPLAAGMESEDTPAPAPAPVINGHAPPVIPPYYPPAPSPAPRPAVYTNGQATTLPGVPGIETDEPIANGIGGLPGVEATPTAFPLVAPALAGVAMLSFGFLKRFFFRYGAKALKALIGVAAFKEFMDFLGLGAPDDAMIRIRKNGKRRYSIGSNPRVGTLQKVSRHCKRLLSKHEKVIREFLPKKQPRYGIPPSKALSAIEKAAIRGT